MIDSPCSIYEEVMGPEFKRLHPMIQKRFGFNSRTNQASIGRGVMERVWHGRFYTLPFLMCGTWRNIMFPESGSDVPFKIENYAYLDEYGRETVTWLRTFEVGRGRRFDAYMVRDPHRNLIVDYLGTHQHLAVDLELTVAANGGLRLLATTQRFYEGRLGFKFPMFFSGTADVCEWFDDDVGTYRIEVVVKNKLWGKLFGYTGSFDVEWLEVKPGEEPASVMPRRVEPRF